MKTLKETIKNYRDLEIKINPEAIDIITEEMVRMMIDDIIYLISYGYFSKYKETNLKTIGTIASIFLSNTGKNIDLWHSLFVLTELNEQENINKDFKENHYKLYYALGGDQMHRNYLPLWFIFQSIIMSTAQLRK